MSKGFKAFLFVVGSLLAIGTVGAMFDKSAKSEAADARASGGGLFDKKLNLTYGFSEGWLISHDFYVTNTTGEDLSEVHLSFRFVGEDGSPKVDRYWASWPLGVKQHITVPAAQVSNVQRITVQGRAEQGYFEADLAEGK